MHVARRPRLCRPIRLVVRAAGAADFDSAAAGTGRGIASGPERRPRSAFAAGTRPPPAAAASAGNQGTAAGHEAAGRRFVHFQEFLQGREIVVRPAVLPLQHPAPDDREYLGERPDRQKSAGLCILGRLQARLFPRQNRQPLPVQDRQGALPGADGPGQGAWGAHDLYQGKHAGLGRILRQGYERIGVGRTRFGGAGRISRRSVPRRAMAMGRDSTGTHGAFTAHARVPAALRTDALSREQG